MKFICAQPAILYYAWQVEVMINNFINNGVDPTDIHIVCAYYGPSSEDFVKLKQKHKDVGFFFYPDRRHKSSYISSIRPHILHQHWLAHPELEHEVVFYHDCDIAFTKQINLEGLLSDDICYLSDTVSYIGANYINARGGENYLDIMAEIVNVPKEKIIAEEKNSGGAQYILKNIPITFWSKVYYDCENMYRVIAAKQNGNPSEPFQIWCSDMWAVLWNLWFYNKDVKVTKKLNFAWSTSPLQDWENCLIYHNAGVTDGNKEMFYKAAFTNKLPYDINLENFDNRFCVYKYAEEILKTKEVSCLI